MTILAMLPVASPIQVVRKSVLEPAGIILRANLVQIAASGVFPGKLGPLPVANAFAEVLCRLPDREDRQAGGIRNEAAARA